MAYKILAINPGSTSTKISFANDNELVFVADIAHSREELSKFKRISDQYHFRKQLVIEELRNRNIPLDFDADVVDLQNLYQAVCSQSQNRWSLISNVQYISMPATLVV